MSVRLPTRFDRCLFLAVCSRSHLLYETVILVLRISARPTCTAAVKPKCSAFLKGNAPGPARAFHYFKYSVTCNVSRLRVPCDARSVSGSVSTLSHLHPTLLAFISSKHFVLAAIKLIAPHSKLKLYPIKIFAQQLGDPIASLVTIARFYETRREIISVLGPALPGRARHAPTLNTPRGSAIFAQLFPEANPSRSLQLPSIQLEAFLGK